MNLAQSLNLFYQELRQPNMNRYPVSLVKEWFDQAERTVNKQAKTIRSSSIIASVAKNRLYDLPSDLLGWQIDDIYYSSSTSDKRKKLVSVTETQLVLINALWKTDTGTPAYWYFDKTKKQFGLYPYPTVGGDDLIEIRYRAKHTKMTRLYTTGTVDVVNANLAVTGNGTSFIGNVKEKDELGIGKLLNRNTDFPNIFYLIASTPVSDTDLVLSSAYEEASASAQSYIISSPSSIDNDELNLAAIVLATALAKKKDGDLNGYASLWGVGLGKIAEEIDNLDRDSASNEPMVPAQASLPPGTSESDYS